MISWIRNRICISLQMTSQNVLNMSLLKHFFKSLNFYFIWKLGSVFGSGSASGRKVGSASTSNKNHNPDPRQGDKSNPDQHPDPHQSDEDPQHCSYCMFNLKISYNEMFVIAVRGGGAERKTRARQHLCVGQRQRRKISGTVNWRAALQRKSHLCIPFLGIEWPQS